MNALAFAVLYDAIFALLVAAIVIRLRATRMKNLWLGVSAFGAALSCWILMSIFLSEVILPRVTLIDAGWEYVGFLSPYFFIGMLIVFCAPIMAFGWPRERN